MRHDNLKLRTKQFALDVIQFVEGLPSGQTCNVLERQLLRSATSVSANSRAACRAKSAVDFVSKMGTVEEEADESGLWMELLVESRKVRRELAVPLLQEASELVAIAVASINTARRSHGKPAAAAKVRISRSALRAPHS